MRASPCHCFPHMGGSVGVSRLSLRRRVVPVLSLHTMWPFCVGRYYTSIPLSGSTAAPRGLATHVGTDQPTVSHVSSLSSLSSQTPSRSATYCDGAAGRNHATRAARVVDAFACRVNRSSPLAPSRVAMEPTPRVVRVPRLLFFGGDIVSVTALEALYERLTAIATFALHAHEEEKKIIASRLNLSKDMLHTDDVGEKSEGSEEVIRTRVARFVADHLTVICPALPRHMTPEEAVAKYTRQYPVARFCAERGLPVIPVDHPRSLAKSRLLEDLLSAKGSTNHHQQKPQRQERDVPKDSRADVTWAARGRPLSDFDLAVVVSFRYFLPKRLLRALPPVINLHPSLLPCYRGASPIFSTLLHNESCGGVSVIQMRPDQQGMDSGSILWQCPVPIELDTDIRTYFPLVTQIGAAGLCDLIFGERTIDELIRAAAKQHPHLSTVMEAMSAKNDERTLSFTPPSAPQADSHEAGAGLTAAGPALALPSDRLLEVVGHSRREGRLRVVASSPLRPHTRADWCTLCRAPPQITQSAVQAAAHSHKESFHNNLRLSEQQRDEKLGLKPARNTAQSRRDAATAVADDSHATHQKDASAHPSPGCGTSPSGGRASHDAASSIYAKYALTEAVTTSMKCADVFPLSVLNPTCDWPDSFTYSWKFAQVQEYDAFSHFSEDPHHAPLLPKEAAVLRFSQKSDRDVFGVWRAFVGGQYFQPAVNAVLDKGCTPVRNQLVRRTVNRLLRQKQRQTFGKPGSKAASQEQQKKKLQKQPCDGESSEISSAAAGPAAEPVVDAQMLRDAEAELRLTCTFTKAIHPELISDALREELDAVEAGEQGRFYRAPTPLFAWVRRREGAAAAAAVQDSAVPDISATTTASASDITCEQHALVLLKRRRREAAAVCCAERGAALSMQTTKEAASLDAAGEERDDATDDVSAEAPRDFLPDIILASPPQPVSARRHLHIPPGTAYFPVSSEDIGAVKCETGWFLWKEAHLRSAAQAQPVALLRKGLAMKTGLLYPGMFSEYLR